MKSKFALLALLFAFILTGCADYQNIPSGYVGMILTPTGWTNKIIESGQVNLGETDANGRQNSLVLLEATSVAVKESFAKTPERDDRIKIGENSVTTDVYVRMIVPTDAQKRSAIFAQITPGKEQGRTSTISLTDIYTRFAVMDVRAAIRQVLGKYDSVSQVNRNREKINNDLAKAVKDMFERSGVPLDLQNVTISNVQEDENIVTSKNNNEAAISEVEKIKKVGQALRENPGYLQVRKYEAYEKMAAKGTTIYIVDGNTPVVIPAK